MGSEVLGPKSQSPSCSQVCDNWLAVTCVPWTESGVGEQEGRLELLKAGLASF